MTTQADPTEAARRRRLAVDEALLNSFEDWLVGGDEPQRTYQRKMTSHVRSLVNALPEQVRGRLLLTNRQLGRLDRFRDFSPATRGLLERFLADGRKVKRTQAAQNLA